MCVCISHVVITVSAVSHSFVCFPCYYHAQSVLSPAVLYHTGVLHDVRTVESSDTTDPGTYVRTYAGQLMTHWTRIHGGGEGVVVVVVFDLLSCLCAVQVFKAGTMEYIVKEVCI